ncbi:hypothetical protein HDU96_006660 [Phlyctochytrium bullatum]|nr:hypothetical protein HDU96_006660 [Phlyctochytrium bullatum]
MDQLSAEIVLDIACHLHPNDLIEIAAVCKSFRSILTLESLSLPFATAHLEATTRRVVRKHSEPWDKRWLHRLETTAPVHFEHPLLFNYGLSAVSMHGLHNLPTLMIGEDWFAQWDLQEVPRKQRRRLSIMASAIAMGLCKVDDTNSMSLELHDLIVLSGMFRSMELLQAVVEAYSGGTLQNLREPFATACILTYVRHDFIEPLALLADQHPVLNLKMGSQSILATAVGMGRTQVVKLMLQKGANLSGDLLDAAVGMPVTDDCASMVKLLLDYGANPNALHQGGFPLHKAAQKGKEDIIRVLLDAGANIDDTDGSGRTPLLVACEKGHDGAAELLMQAGANVDFVSKVTGETLLHVALGRDAFYKSRIARKLLEKAPALCEIRDKRGETPFELAKRLYGETEAMSPPAGSGSLSRPKHLHGKKL